VLDNQFVLYTDANQWREGAVLDGSAFVTISTGQTISGAKTFSADTTFSENVNVIKTVTANAFVGDGSGITGLTAAPVASVNSKVGVVVLNSTDVGALSTTGGSMTGDITFNSGQEFPGTVTNVNGQSPSAAGLVTLSAANVDAVSKDSGGTFAAEVRGVQTTASSTVNSFVTKDYVDAGVASASNDVESITAGNGLTGVTIDKDNPNGTLAVLADGNTITVGASGIKVNETNLTFPVTEVNGEVGDVVLSASDVNAIADNNGTYTGTLTGVNAVLSGDLDSNTLDVTTNATVGGTLGITGATTATTIGATDITATGTVTANAFVGDGSALTGLPASGAVVGSTPPSNPESGDLWYSDIRYPLCLLCGC
jgi:hypothetical protein